MLSSDFNIDSKNPKIPETELFLSLINKAGTLKKIPKGRQVIKPGTPATDFFLVAKGIFKTSIIVDDKQYALGFTFPGDVDGCPTALLHGKENNFLIESIANSEILICSLEKFRKSCTEVEYYRIISQVLTFYLSVVEKRLMDAISLTAEQRYEQLLKWQPKKVKEIPLSAIASYLGISQERLSRIRKKLRI